MGIEYSARFDDEGWYLENRFRIVERIEALESFVRREERDEEFWLKEANTGDWPYDVRVFVLSRGLSVEVSSFSKAFTNDVVSLLSWIGQQTTVELVDDDGIPLAY